MKLSNDLRDHLASWLKANGIDISTIPTEPHMTFDGRELTTDVFLFTEDGQRLLSPGRDELAITTATYTITTPPPADVAWWLRDRCPTCGR